MELVSRMMDGSIPLEDRGAAEAALAKGPPVRQDDKIERLQTVPIFQSCTRRQLRAVARITGVFDAPTGKLLTRAGEPGNEFFLILDGTARVDVTSRKQVRLGPGDFFGEMSLLDGGPRSATVIAETPLRLLVINRRNFASVLEQVPALAHTLLVTLSRRVRQAEQSARD
jgi:CRP/FNR family transcriptional regulator, cyclic AMP receptor protein